MHTSGLPAIPLAPQIWFAAIEYQRDWTTETRAYLEIWFGLLGHLREVGLGKSLWLQLAAHWQICSGISLAIDKASVNMDSSLFGNVHILLMKRNEQVFEVQLLDWQLNTPNL